MCVFCVHDGSVPRFFSGLRRKHLFITTCIEKHCTRPLRFCSVCSYRETSKYLLKSFLALNFALQMQQTHQIYQIQTLQWQARAKIPFTCKVRNIHYQVKRHDSQHRNNNYHWQCLFRIFNFFCDASDIVEAVIRP